MSASEIEYLREKKVPELMEALISQLLAARPDAPRAFLREVLNRPNVPGIIISGPPSSGKGTQCEELVAHFGVVHISTGDLLRAEVRSGSETGQQCQQIMREGGLVPDDIIINMVRVRVQQPDVLERGYILDGFPRTIAQAQALSRLGLIPHIFLLLDVPDAVVKTRIAGRRQDPVTGHTYHLTFKPPPQDDEELLARLIQRKDDLPEVIVSRLASYHRYTEPIVEHYQSIVAKVDGNRDIRSVARDCVEAVGERLHQ